MSATVVFLLISLLSACMHDKEETGLVDDHDHDGFSADIDCDDSSYAIHPDAFEVCNGLDDDCDGTVDEPGVDGATYGWVDADRDGYGDPDRQVTSCDDNGAGSAVDNDEDCDDDDASVNPEATDVSDGVDNNCDGQIDGHGPDDSGAEGEGEGETSETGETGVGEGEGEGEGEPDFVATWVDDYTLKITITGGSGKYMMGMTETDATSADPWTGEDCLDGYVLSDGSMLLFCHPLDETGGTFESIYPDVVDGTRDIFSLDEDTETLFYADFEDSITYGVWSASTGYCWTWGADPSYYTSEGCTRL